MLVLNFLDPFPVDDVTPETLGATVSAGRVVVVEVVDVDEVVLVVDDVVVVGTVVVVVVVVVVVETFVAPIVVVVVGAPVVLGVVATVVGIVVVTSTLFTEVVVFEGSEAPSASGEVGELVAVIVDASGAVVGVREALGESVD